MPILCPVCGKDDATQKLSAIVSSGQASGTFSGPSAGVIRVGGKWGATGTYTTLSGSTATELARKLSPPPEPRKPSGLGCWLYVGLFGSAVGALSVGSVLVVNLSDESAPYMLFALLFYLSILVITVVMHNTKKSRQIATYTLEKPAWDAAMKRYKSLYYCFRDDVVFDPQTGETCAPESLNKFLYSGR
jgi:hypothetical protein